MKIRLSKLAAVLAPAMLLACTETSGPASDSLGQRPAAETQTADRIFVNGKILTVDADFSVREAIAVAGDRILSVGSDAEIASLVAATTEIVDLMGRTVVPGLIDNHLHFVRATRDWYRQARWDGVTSRAAALRMIAERSRSLPPGEWVVVLGGWTFEQFADDTRPFTVSELDAVAPGRPVYVQEGYRRGFANSLALAAAGLERDAILGERGAMGLVDAAIPEVASSVWDASLQQTIVDLHAMGLTSIYDVGGNGVTPEYYEAVGRAAETGNLTMRVFYSLHSGLGVGPTAVDIIAALESRSPDLDGLRFAQFGWGETTYAPMRAQPWEISDDDLEAYRAIALTAAARGWQMHEHSMRDEKIDAMLTVFESVDAERSIRDSRWTIAHTNGISPESIARANALGMVFAVHSSSRLATAEAVARGSRPPPIAMIRDSGAVWGLGSDATVVASPNPFHNIGWAVTGLAPSGEQNLEQTVSREDALQAYTRSNAYLLFREADLGSLEPGKLADFVVLDRDYSTVPATEIKDLRSLMTIVGGETVYAEAAN
jgi:predicted amidohydrolase YtcJ